MVGVNSFLRDKISYSPFLTLVYCIILEADVIGFIPEETTVLTPWHRLTLGYLRGTTVGAS